MIIRTPEEIQEIRNRMNGRDSKGNKIPKGLPKNNLSKLVTFWTNCIIPFWM